MRAERGRGYQQPVLHWLLLLLLITAGCRAEKDPFQPPGTVCETAQSAPFNWRLKGIIGRADDYHAWLTPEKGKGMPRSQGQQIDQRWQLIKVEAMSITLADVKGCLSPLKRNLKGSIYEKDLLPVMPAVPGATSG
ncbi:HofP DNA utilization family protein [Erwinia sp. E_sp_B04_7]|uniref:HofP DNA utilization family protein n=1 Tax=unclassified Erwinia TaxID=2622719 RepID=UPI0030CD3C69